MNYDPLNIPTTTAQGPGGLHFVYFVWSNFIQLS